MPECNLLTIFRFTYVLSCSTGSFHRKEIIRILSEPLRNTNQIICDVIVISYEPQIPPFYMLCLETGCRRNMRQSPLPLCTDILVLKKLNLNIIELAMYPVRFGIFGLCETSMSFFSLSKF